MLKVVKIGGNVIDNDENLDNFLRDFASLPEPKILVHGGGKLATEMSKKMGIEPKVVDGRRFTDRETLDIVTMVYAGLINKNVVAKLQAYGCNSIGLSGADGNTIPAVKRPPHPLDYGYAGDLDASKIDAEFITTLLDKGVTPVFCAITHDQKGTLLNTNADTIASEVAVAVSRITPTQLVYCFEMNGVLSDPNDGDSVIKRINDEDYKKLKDDGTISGGMLPKIYNAFAAIKQGVKEVVIKNSAEIKDETKGTVIV